MRQTRGEVAFDSLIAAESPVEIRTFDLLFCTLKFQVEPREILKWWAADGETAHFKAPAKDYNPSLIPTH